MRRRMTARVTVLQPRFLPRALSEKEGCRSSAPAQRCNERAPASPSRKRSAQCMLAQCMKHGIRECCRLKSRNMAQFIPPPTGVVRRGVRKKFVCTVPGAAGL
eukprot:13714448-Alexandrium_andersonii.AAC.1